MGGDDISSAVENQEEDKGFLEPCRRGVSCRAEVWICACTFARVQITVMHMLLWQEGRYTHDQQWVYAAGINLGIFSI